MKDLILAAAGVVLGLAVTVGFVLVPVAHDVLYFFGSLAGIAALLALVGEVAAIEPGTLRLRVSERHLRPPEPLPS